MAQERPTLTSNLRRGYKDALLGNAKTEENGVQPSNKQDNDLLNPTTTKTTFKPWNRLTFKTFQKQLIRCQHALDAARQLGWDRRPCGGL